MLERARTDKMLTGRQQALRHVKYPSATEEDVDARVRGVFPSHAGNAPDGGRPSPSHRLADNSHLVGLHTEAGIFVSCICDTLENTRLCPSRTFDRRVVGSLD